MKVTVGLAVYNAGEHLRLAVLSVLNQTYINIEVLVVDDGSEDGCLRFLGDIEDPRLKILSDGANLGLAKRLNQLVNISSGELFFRMDADDIMHPERVEKQVGFMIMNQDIDLVSSNAAYISYDNKYTGHSDCYTQDVFLNFMKNRSGIIHPSVVARRSWFLRNRYDEEMGRAQDFELWARAFLNNDLKYKIMPEYLLFYRNENSLNRQKYINVFESEKYVFKKLLKFKHRWFFSMRAYLKLLAVKSIFFFRFEKILLSSNKKATYSKKIGDDVEKIVNNLKSGY
ncbi:glycosyltransferase family 2 protein [Vibrio crassostreae]|uniref:glycosyltransferase family 2 protein n=1 Tax=Vibrio crassostreae TaxID=246167 RepID=UPI001043C503|nr:glycosyltransferase [Vibrio crassostreae]TCT71104.1 glycosyltransferase involved in cell wall biosynthesis [Vibrio crassostreae]CAK2197822.1 hypothetical protein VCRA2110O135_80185 [Vibrio crassostreae]CAK2402428.1 hypothetical protein VCRA2111O136_110170 [Vibrio crassostreae]CAK2906786.1 hypothetical protein VCRA217O134_290033 [Vibrio crassostreae]